jgi:tRNA-splicing ligase RtcB
VIEIIVPDTQFRIKSWCNQPEEKALEQARNLARLPFLAGDVCLMPDTHSGYGMPIGGVIITDNVIIPNAVGVDIGCGMVAQRSDINISYLSEDNLKTILGKIRNEIPVGFSHRKVGLPDLMPVKENMLPIVAREWENATYQLGTLGGGNHFIELQKDTDGYLWVMIHSGSRNIGKQVADWYVKEALDVNIFGLDPKWELNGFPLDHPMGQQYAAEMEYCLRFALANRQIMLEAVRDCINSVCLANWDKESINIHHNYAALEEHNGKKVWIHRKGATAASKGLVGIIPGSQGTSSYIVEGLGNEASYQSCSHGAGRRMSRAAARKNLNLDEEQKMMNDKGIIHALRGAHDLDEAPGAYKDIQVVMDEQKDLVNPIVQLEAIGVIKG